MGRGLSYLQKSILVYVRDNPCDFYSGAARWFGENDPFTRSRLKMRSKVSTGLPTVYKPRKNGFAARAISPCFLAPFAGSNNAASSFAFAEEKLSPGSVMGSTPVGSLSTGCAPKRSL
jgi:hypothetical protein